MAHQTHHLHQQLPLQGTPRSEDGQDAHGVQPSDGLAAKMSLLQRVATWASNRISQEHHCALPVVGLEWHAIPDQTRGSALRTRYVCPECGQHWGVPPSS
jgi:hypothetical protein